LFAKFTEDDEVKKSANRLAEKGGRRPDFLVKRIRKDAAIGEINSIALFPLGAIVASQTEKGV